MACSGTDRQGPLIFPPKYVQRNHPCLVFSSILDKGVLVMPDLSPSSPVLRGFYKVDPSLVPVPCHVGIPLSSFPAGLGVERVFQAAQSYCDAFLRPSISGTEEVNSTLEVVNRDWQAWANTLRAVRPLSLADPFWCGRRCDSGVPTSLVSNHPLFTPSGSIAVRRDTDYILCVRGANSVSVEYHPKLGIPPCVFIHPCALFKWEFFDAFDRHYNGFPDLVQQKRAEKLTERWARPTLKSLGYAAWMSGRVCGTVPPNPCISEQIEYCLSKGGNVGPMKYPYLRSRR